MSTFHGMWDREESRQIGSRLSQNKVRFHAKNVHAKMMTYDSDYKAESAGKFFVESGQVVLWRNTMDNTLALAFLGRHDENDCCPKKVVPLGLVIKKEFSIVSSSKEEHTRGRFILTTSVSVDMIYTTKPMIIVFYINLTDAMGLDKEMMKATAKFPHQQAKTILHPTSNY
jgi:hypothetical protein|mmetsp:Transcript_1616/g.2305  ORF Transcript_1616/g.2305 Transcript_1616/m.2305 type:complete len:171 (+) Transcript_1616:131-643(+)